MKYLLILLFLLHPLIALDKVSLQLMWLDQFQFAGYYMAKEKGFYRDAGLDVTIKKFQYETDVVDEVLSKRATFGVGRSSLVRLRSEGKKVFLLSAIFQSSPFMLLALKSSNINTLKERIKKRGRNSETQIPDNYLELLNELYEQYISRHAKAPILIIDTDNHSFDLKRFVDHCVDKIVENIKQIDLRVNTPGISKWVTLPQTAATIKAIGAESKLEEYLSANPKLITIAGNVGLGKSTLTAIMERSLKIKAL